VERISQHKQKPIPRFRALFIYFSSSQSIDTKYTLMENIGFHVYGTTRVYCHRGGAEQALWRRHRSTSLCWEKSFSGQHKTARGEKLNFMTQSGIHVPWHSTTTLCHLQPQSFFIPHSLSTQCIYCLSNNMLKLPAVWGFIVYASRLADRLRS
jgi:hypothetical protein